MPCVLSGSFTFSCNVSADHIEPPQRRKSQVMAPAPTAGDTPQHVGLEDSDENCGVDLDGVDIAAVQASMNNAALPGVSTSAAAATPPLTPNVCSEPEPLDAAGVSMQFVTKLLHDANCLSPLHRFWLSSGRTCNVWREV